MQPVGQSQLKLKSGRATASKQYHEAGAAAATTTTTTTTTTTATQLRGPEREREETGRERK